MFLFLTAETLGLALGFVLTSKLAKSYLAAIFPLKNCIYVVPFNNVDGNKVDNAGETVKPKPANKKKDQSAANPLIDYEKGAVVANYENLAKLDGMPDYDFLLVLTVTTLIAMMCKLGIAFARPLLAKGSHAYNFTEDQNIDVYLLVFVASSFMSLCWKNLKNLTSMKDNRAHSIYFALGTILLGMFFAIGYKRFFVLNVQESLARFNTGVSAFIQATLKKSEGIEEGAGTLLTLNGFGWIVTLLSTLIVGLSGPSIVKFVEAFQIYRKTIRHNQDALDRIGSTPQDQESSQASQRLLKQAQNGSRLQIVVLVLQATNIILHIRGVGDQIFGTHGLHVAASLLALQFVGLIAEVISTHCELKIRSQYIFELLVPYQPKDAYTKELYIKRCLTFYKESVKQMLHAVSKFFLPFVILLLALTFLRKEYIYTGSASTSSPSAGFVTPVIQNPLLVLRDYTSLSPLTQSSKVVAVIRGFGVCRGLDALNAHSENPFRLTADLSLGLLLNKTFLDLAMMTLLLVQTCKFLVTTGYLTVVVSTTEDID